MKYIGKKSLCLLFTLCLMANLCAAFAAERSSLYISSYCAHTTAIGNGKVAVTVDVSGRGYQAEIGATTIYLYESTDNEYFVPIGTYRAEEYPEMLGSGTFYYEDAVVYQGQVGHYYKALVYCYAGNGTTGDTRDYMTASVRAYR